MGVGGASAAVFAALQIINSRRGNHHEESGTRSRIIPGISWPDAACEQEWFRLLDALKGKTRILVICSGQTADVTLPKLRLEDYAVISVNESYSEFNSVIHVSVDAHCLEDWYQERWPDEPVWVGRLGLEDLKYRDIIPAQELGPLFIPHVGSGTTALMIGWELARRIQGEVTTIGLDLGAFFKRNGPGHYASFCMRDKAKRQDHRKEGWIYQYGPYQKQRKDLARFAAYHRLRQDAPRVVSLSALDWTRLEDVGRIHDCLDHAIIGETIQYLTKLDCASV